MNRALVEGPAAGVDKRKAILSAALRLIARSGLHNTPVSAIARAAGVAAGTIYLYFQGKEELINALYLALVGDRLDAITRAVDPYHSVRDRLWSAWSSSVRWHLDNRDASNVIQQCEASGILTDETRARQAQLEAEGRQSYAAAVREGLIRDMPLSVFHALFNGPILALTQMQEKQDPRIDEGILRLIFEGICRSVLRSPDGQPTNARLNPG